MKTENSEFTNPWEVGVTYSDFLKAIPKGKTVREYLTGKLPTELEEELINWIENDLEHFEPYKEFKKQLKNK